MEKVLDQKLGAIGSLIMEPRNLGQVTSLNSSVFSTMNIPFSDSRGNTLLPCDHVTPQSVTLFGNIVGANVISYDTVI